MISLIFSLTTPSAAFAKTTASTYTFVPAHREDRVYPLSFNCIPNTYVKTPRSGRREEATSATRSRPRFLVARRTRCGRVQVRREEVPHPQSEEEDRVYQQRYSLRRRFCARIYRLCVPTTTSFETRSRSSSTYRYGPLRSCSSSY